MTIVEKILLVGYIIMAFFFAADIIVGLIFGYVEGKQAAEREMKMDRILELIDNDLGDNIFPDLGGDK